MMLDTQANVPASVAVVFPRADSSILGTDVYEVSVTLASLALTEYAGEFGRPDVSQIIHSTAVANYSGGGSPVNAAELLALAQQIATDFYLWRLALVEARYRSIVPWTADGMHDVEWTHGGGMTTAVHRSEWDPEFGQLKHAGTYGSSDVPAATGITHINNDATALQQIAVGDAGSDLNIATTAAAYDNAKTYSKGWVVLSSGSTYRFINATPSAGHSPPNATYWEDVTGQGLTIVNVPDISIPASITSINSSSVAAQNITVKTYPNSYGIPYLASSISGVAWSSSATYLANAVVTVGTTPYRALSLNTNLNPSTNPGTWVDITSQALWVLNLPDAGWTDGLQTKSGFVTDTVQVFDGAKTWNNDGTFVHNLAVGDDLTVSGKTNCTHVRTSTADGAGRVYGTFTLDDADPAYELRCYQKNVVVAGTPYDLSCALVIQADGGFNFLRASNAANAAGPPRVRVQSAGGPDNVGGTFSATWKTGYTGTANGMEFTSGWYTGPGSTQIDVSYGGTGRTTLDSGQLLAGAGTSAVDSLSSTRVSGETIELKLGSDSWIAFSEGSF